ncbi:UNVERIFIED_CONTAM: Cytosolic sulfotransferase 15 [Sesamum radiatum]|uniref:Sulfotransferase n=1 Tax=Sesamum radiatum TaxID=300843 RepID=A0AAW2KSA2_SESRA
MEKKECSSAEVDHSSPKDEFQELLQTLEHQTNWDGQRLVKYDGIWLVEQLFRPILSAQKYFKAKDTDVILSNMPKSGTTWLKALTYSIANRSVFPIDRSPLLTSNPHNVVPALEFDLYWGKGEENPDPESFPEPRILATHIPFEILPDSIRESDCRIIYISRNPLDIFISQRQFLLENKFAKDAVPLELDEAFDMFCRGITAYGPFWDHMLGYWNAHLKNPERFLFLKYEDLKGDILSNVKKIAEFMGFPFSPEEEKQGVVEQISRLCSFENLKNLEVNKSGNVMGLMKNSSFFRKGEVGDWVNYLSPEMAERIKNIMESKFQGSGLIFNI